jgi:glycosyltransferase involved in cell wall biosynthesis
MKILFYNHTSQVSGAERVLLLILRQLSRDGFQPLLVCPGEGKLQNEAKAVGVHCETVDQLRARFTRRIDHLLRYLTSFVSVMRQVRAQVVKFQPEVIHANSIRAGLVVSAATIGLGIPVIWHVHDLLPRHPFSTLIRLLVFILPQIRIVAVSRVAADRLRGDLPRWLPSRTDVTVLHNSVDVKRLSAASGGFQEANALRKELRLRAADPLIGIVGNLSPGKGQLELITAYAEVLKKIPDSALLIVGSALFNGEDGYQQLLSAQAKALGIADRLRFLGQRNDVPAIMRSLDLLVLNSKSEAFPLAALEGLASGVAVLSTSVGGVPELINHGENGWLIPSGDQNKLAEAIVLLMTQPELRARLAEKGHQHVATNFTVDKFMAQLEVIYAQTARRKPATQTEKRNPGASVSMSDPPPAVAVFHDNFAQMGGAERVAEEIYNLLPGAILHSTVAVPEILSPGLRKAKIKTTWMQTLPGLKRYFRHYFLFYPFAVESVDLSRYDLIVSSCFGYAKGVRKRRGTVHVCYCHTPMRWVWRYEDYSARANFGGLARRLLPIMLSGLRRWDLRASRQPDYFIANSQVVAERIKRVYGRESVVIPPPIDVDRFQPDNVQENYYLVLSRLVPYKRIDLAVEACTRLNRELVIVGDGPDRARLQELAGPSVRFVGRQTDEAVARYAARCRALLFPGEEDFGMTPLEVNAAGRPVIAFRAGGALETVIEGLTGLFFDQPTSDSLTQAIEDFELRSWNPSDLRAHACKFDHKVFATRFLEFLRQTAPDMQVEGKPVWDKFAALDTSPTFLPGLRPAG